MAEKPATSSQLAYLRSLADRTGQTFTYPKTSRQASAEIGRLKNIPRQSPSERQAEREHSTDYEAVSAGGATRVRKDETTGYGSQATWTQNRQAPAEIVSSHPAPRRMAGPTLGKRVELGRYTVPAGERVLYAQRVDGIVRLTDRPASKVTTTNRAHLVEAAVDSKAELDAIVTDYLNEAQRLRVVPAAAIPFDRFLAELDAE